MSDTIRMLALFLLMPLLVAVAETIISQGSMTGESIDAFYATPLGNFTHKPSIKFAKALAAKYFSAEKLVSFAANLTSSPLEIFRDCGNIILQSMNESSTFNSQEKPSLNTNNSTSKRISIYDIDQELPKVPSAADILLSTDELHIMAAFLEANSKKLDSYTGQRIIEWSNENNFFQNREENDIQQHPTDPVAEPDDLPQNDALSSTLEDFVKEDCRAKPSEKATEVFGEKPLLAPTDESELVDKILQDETVHKAPSSLEQHVDGVSPNQTEGNTLAAPSELRSLQNSASSINDIFKIALPIGSSFSDDVAVPVERHLGPPFSDENEWELVDPSLTQETHQPTDLTKSESSISASSNENQHLLDSIDLAKQGSEEARSSTLGDRLKEDCPAQPCEKAIEVFDEKPLFAPADKSEFIDKILQDEAVPKAPSSLEQDVDGISPNQTEGNTSAAPSELRSPQNSTSSSSDIFAPIQRQPTLYFDADDGECVLDGLSQTQKAHQATDLTKREFLISSTQNPRQPFLDRIDLAEQGSEETRSSALGDFVKEDCSAQPSEKATETLALEGIAELSKFCRNSATQNHLHHHLLNTNYFAEQGSEGTRSSTLGDLVNEDCPAQPSTEALSPEGIAELSRFCRNSATRNHLPHHLLSTNDLAEQGSEEVLSNPNWSSNTETCSGAIVESSSSIELQPIRKQVTSLSAPGSASSSSNTAPLSARDYHRGQMVSVERQTPALSSTASNTPHPLEEMVPNTGTQAALITQPPVKKVPVVQEDVFGDAKECPFTVASASSPSSVELFSSFSFPRPRLSSSTSSRSEVPSAKAEGQIISISQSSPVEVSAVSTPTTIVVRQAASASAKDPPIAQPSAEEASSTAHTDTPTANPLSPRQTAAQSSPASTTLGNASLASINVARSIVLDSNCQSGEKEIIDKIVHDVPQPNDSAANQMTEPQTLVQPSSAPNYYARNPVGSTQARRAFSAPAHYVVEATPRREVPLAQVRPATSANIAYTIAPLRAEPSPSQQSMASTVSGQNFPASSEGEVSNAGLHPVTISEARAIDVPIVQTEVVVTKTTSTYKPASSPIREDQAPVQSSQASTSLEQTAIPYLDGAERLQSREERDPAEIVQPMSTSSARLTPAQCLPASTTSTQGSEVHSVESQPSAATKNQSMQQKLLVSEKEAAPTNRDTYELSKWTSHILMAGGTVVLVILIIASSYLSAKRRRQMKLRLEATNELNTLGAQSMTLEPSFHNHDLFGFTSNRKRPAWF